MPLVYTWMKIPASLHRFTAARKASSPSRGGQKFGKPVSYGMSCHQYQSSAAGTPDAFWNLSTGGITLSTAPRFQNHMAMSRIFPKSRVRAARYHGWCRAPSR